MKAIGNYVLLGEVEHNEEESEIMTPDGKSKYFYEVLSAGEEVDNVGKGDVVTLSVAGGQGWWQIGGRKIFLANSKQIASIGLPGEGDI